MELILKAKDIRVEFKGRDVLDIEALELGNKKIDELRKEINNINIQMIKFSLLGETILEWNDKDIEHYHARRMAMDSMLCRFKGVMSDTIH